MSYYVHRVNTGTGREGWVGPIRSEKQARREVQAWQSAEDSFGNGWTASLHESTAEVKRAVREWLKARRA